MPDTTGLILLAAGRSSRLGQPKQLLKFAGETLLRRAARTALASRCRPVGVVLGYDHERMREELRGLPVQVWLHENWEEGMGSSLRFGLGRLQDIAPDLAAAVVMLCDQPFLNAAHLDALQDAFAAQECRIVASEYAGVSGTPCLFHRALFPELEALRGESGAKSLLPRYRATTLAVPFPQGNLDMDTPEDAARLHQMHPAE